MNNPASFITSPTAALSLKDIEAAVEKLRGIPPANWMLVAPDGRMWADPNVEPLVRVLVANRKLGVL